MLHSYIVPAGIPIPLKELVKMECSVVANLSWAYCRFRVLLDPPEKVEEVLWDKDLKPDFEE